MPSQFSWAAFLLPGKLITNVVPRCMHNARESIARGVMARLCALMPSAMPGTSRSHTSRVASGVTSLRLKPVPPHVSTTSTLSSSAARTMAAAISGRSSFTTSYAAHCHPWSAISSRSSAPAVSSFSLRVSEQVITANVIIYSTVPSSTSSNRQSIRVPSGTGFWLVPSGSIARQFAR